MLHKVKRKSYRDYLIQYIDSLSPDDLILTDRAVSYACRKLKTPPEAARKAVNVTLARLEKEGYIIRLTKGVYCKKTKTAFGYYKMCIRDRSQIHQMVIFPLFFSNVL